MTCSLCLERGKTWDGSDPRCAFENGVFDTENWNCATMNELRDISERLETNRRDDNACACIGYVPFEGDEYSGYIVMTWYKNRGRTGNALIMWDDEKERPLKVEDAIEAVHQNKKKNITQTS